MKILIVEDEPFAADDLTEKLQSLQYRVIAVADSYQTALEAILKERPDLAFVDIELKGDLTGIDLAEELKMQKIPFIYLSGVQDLNTYQKAKNTVPLKNLAKPIDPINLRNALLDLDLNLPIKPETLPKLHMISDKEGRKRRIDPDQILYMVAGRSYCDLFFANASKITVSTSMGPVLGKLNHPKLVRISRSNAVHIDHVKGIWGNEVEMPGDVKLTMKGNYKEDFIHRINIL